MDKSAKANVETESGNEEANLSEEEQLIPAYKAAIMRKQYLQGVVKSLPAPMQNRIVALKNIQIDHFKLEAEFYAEVYNLEKKYQVLYQQFFEKRKDIVNGSLEPPQEAPNWKEEGEAKDEEYMKKIKPVPEDAKGIPNFWLNIFRASPILSAMVQKYDEPALKHLTDITIKFHADDSYTLEFHFNKNKYFSNAVLTKQYFLKFSVDEDAPFGFEGPEIYKCKGCVIHWQKKMNLTVKTIRKKQKHKETGSIRTIVIQVPNDSFFNFFDPPFLPPDKDYFDEESKGILATDFEIGHFLRTNIIPKAVLYYTGDVVDVEYDDQDNFVEEGEKEVEEKGEEKGGNSDEQSKKAPTDPKKSHSKINECPSQ